MPTVKDAEMVSIVISNRPNGLECVVKDCKDDILESPPSVGSFIIVKHVGVNSGGILKNPVYWRQLDSVQQHPQVPNPHWIALLLYIQAPDWRNPFNHKEFFERSAQVMNISQPSDWHKVKREDVIKRGGMRMLKQHYGNSLYKVCAKVSAG